MELELGLEVSQARDGFASSIQISKDSSPYFSSKETEAMFFLIGNLPGFKKENIKIEIDNGGTLRISGEKSVQEVVMVKWAVRKGRETKSFRKVFLFPEGVVLDRIRARFDEEDGILLVSMPKSICGIISGIGIEEEKTEQDDNADRQQGLVIDVALHKVAGRPTTEQKQAPAKEIPEVHSTEMREKEEITEDLGAEKREELEAPDQQIPEAPATGEEQEIRVTEKEIPEPSTTETQREQEIETEQLQDQNPPAKTQENKEFGLDVEEPNGGEEEHEPEGDRVEIPMLEIAPNNQTPDAEKPALEPEIPEASSSDGEQEGEILMIEMPVTEQKPDLNNQTPDAEKPALEPEIPEASSCDGEQEGEILMIEMPVTEQKPDLEIRDEEDQEKPDQEFRESPEAPLTEQEQDPNYLAQVAPLAPKQEPDEEFPDVETQEATPAQEIPKLEISGQRQDEKLPEMEMKIPSQLPEVKMPEQEQDGESPKMEKPDQGPPETETRHRRNQDRKDKSTQTPPGIVLCPSCMFAGSAFIVSLIVLVVHLLRNKQQKQ